MIKWFTFQNDLSFFKDFPSVPEVHYPFPWSGDLFFVPSIQLWRQTIWFGWIISL